MFTGIIQSIGRIRGIEHSNTGLALNIELGGLDVSSIALGESISVNGTCLTVTQIQDGLARFDVSDETLDKCLISNWQLGDAVNIEPALTLQTPIGGHLVSGHVDGAGELVMRQVWDDYTEMRFRTSKTIGQFIAIKGSITIDGVSLTSNKVTDDGDQTDFEVMLVPHTLANTTLGGMRVGHKVHLEIDLVARYLQRLNEAQKEA